MEGAANKQIFKRQVCADVKGTSDSFQIAFTRPAGAA